ncbi:MAG: hypothetical protein JNM57_03525 [Cyclobacteriaceae bacterium]|nr:hypothetical protein [Cyclobacteriaceae bacterium]
MTKSFLVILVLIAAGCADSEDRGKETSVFLAVKKAAGKCQTSLPAMTWLRDLIQNSQNNPHYQGDFYAVSTSMGTVIVQQPLIMSCLGCIRFDCSGNPITTIEDSRLEELMQGINSDNKIYSWIE